MKPIDSIVLALAELINVLYKVAHKGGLFVLAELSDEVMALTSVSKDDVLAQLKVASEVAAERARLEQLFKSKLVLEDKVLELKVEAGADCLEQAVEVAYDGLELFNRGKSVVEKVKSLFA